jgi:membrane protease YdiL (CAAX protease family)
MIDDSQVAPVYNEVTVISNDPGQAPTTPRPEPRSPNKWPEMAAVLAVGVVPPLSGALLAEPYLSPSALPPFWRSCLGNIVYSTCTIYVVLYLISRSGDSWARFGLARPRYMDIVIGSVMFLVGIELWQLFPAFRSLDANPPKIQWFSNARRIDLLIAALTFMISAFSEELVTRSYLITRLEELLHSRGQAVVIAASAFGSYHVYQGFQALAAMFVFGLVYGAAYILIRRVWPLAIGHCLISVLITWINLPVS